MELRFNVLVYLYGNVEEKWPRNMASNKWKALSTLHQQGEIIEALLPLHTKVCEKLQGKNWPGFIAVRASRSLDPHIPLVIVTATYTCRRTRCPPRTKTSGVVSYGQSLPKTCAGLHATLYHGIPC